MAVRSRNRCSKHSWFVLGKCWLFLQPFLLSVIKEWWLLSGNNLVTDPNISMMRGTHQNSLLYLPCVVLCFFVEPMRTPKRLKIAETRSRLIAVDWESLGYNITRCHTFNVTICYHYMTANNRSKADCLDMDPKGNTQLNYKSRQCCHYLSCCFAV